MMSEISIIGLILSLVLTFHFGFILGREYKILKEKKEIVFQKAEEAGEKIKKILKIKKPVSVIRPDEIGSDMQKKAEAEKDGKELKSWRDS